MNQPIPVAQIVSSPLSGLNFPELLVRQRRELAELFGFETRNKYEVTTPDQQPIFFAAEQGKGFLGFVARGFLGHWRTFRITFFNAYRQEVFSAFHPFRFLFQRLEVAYQGRFLGAIQQRLAWFRRRFDVEGPLGQVLLTIDSPLLSPWTFPFFRAGRQMAVIEKKWSGFLSEAFTDRDNFRVVFQDPSLTEEERALILAAALLVDLTYFENKAN